MSGYGFSLFGKKSKTSSMDDIDRVLSRMDKIQKEIEILNKIIKKSI